MKLRREPLENAIVRLEPLTEAHREDLRAAAHTGIDWRVYPLAMTGENFERWFDGALKLNEAGSEIGYAARDLNNGALAGSTRFMNIAAEHKRVEIGGTWYAKWAQGTKINPACKFAMMNYAFAQGANRVELKVDARNAHSRAAVLKLGAREEGVLRRHMINHDGFVRDTVYYAVLAEEWPDVRAKLELRLA